MRRSLFLLLFIAAPVQAQDSVVEKARAIQNSVITIDTHVDIPFNFGTPEVNACNEVPGRQVDLPKMKAGGLDVVFWSIFVGQGPRTPDGYQKAYEGAMSKITGVHRMAEQMCPDKVEIAYTPEDVVRIHAQGKLVATMGMENGYPLGKDLSLVKKFYDLGVRYITLSHGGHNDIADSATPRPDEPAAEHNGLSRFGEDVVREMNRVGIMVDVSHISKAAMLHAVRISKAPVIGSHSGVRAVSDHPRNMDDEQLLALKKNGGVIQVVGLATFVKNIPEQQAAIQALRAKYGIAAGGRGALNSLTPEKRTAFDREMDEINRRWPRANVQDFVNHIDHAVKLIGIEHVGISSDMDGGGGIDGWNDATEMLNVTAELVRRGYTKEQIEKLWGGNLLRVWREVQEAARNAGSATD